MPTKSLPAILKTPQSRAVYVRLLEELRRLGPFEADAKKTSIHITNGRAFVGVHPRAGGIVLQIVTEKPLRNARVSKVEQVSTHRYHNTVKLEDPAEVDAQLVSWLQQAHALTD